MDRRQFLTTASAVGTAAIVPRQFVRSIEERNALESVKAEMLGTANAIIRLYHDDVMILATDTGIDREVKGLGVIVYGQGAEVQVTSKVEFTFNRVTLELEGLHEVELPFQGQYTVTPGNTLTLQADARGLLTMEA